jgi:hypothetical protein
MLRWHIWSFERHGQTSGYENYATCNASDCLVKPAGMIPEFAGEHIIRNNAEPDLVGDQDDWPGSRTEGANEPARLGRWVIFGRHEVSEP